MSGTSLDGIDVAIVDITFNTGRNISTVAFRSTPYPKQVRAALLAISNAMTHTADHLAPELPPRRTLRRPLFSKPAGARRIPLRFHRRSSACTARPFFTKASPSSISAAASPALFRSAKPPSSPSAPACASSPISASATSPPEARAPRWSRSSITCCSVHRRIARVALNIGGIANITISATNPNLAFDTGPGNMVIDALVALHTHGRARFDRDGTIARRASTNPEAARQTAARSLLQARPAQILRPRTIRPRVRQRPYRHRHPHCQT